MTFSDNLSVTISVLGRFHAFDLARELHRRRALCQLITSYPKFKARQWGIPNDRLSTVLSNELLCRVVYRSNVFRSIRNECQFLFSRRYDRIASRRIPHGTRLFVGWSSMCIESIRHAKQLGALTIVERGSTHILFQNLILKEEYARLGVRWDGIHPGIIDRELQEYAESDYISVPTHFVKDTFVEFGVDPGKLLVTPYGCDTSIFRPQPKADRTFRLIHCGAISIQKGVHFLIQAFAELHLPNAELWLIGGVTPEISQILRRYPDSSVFTKGPFRQNSLAQYYSQGSVFCSASLQDGLAMVIPQAMCCGLPVIATYNSGAAEVVRDGVSGYLVPAGNVDILKERILRLYEDPDLREHMSRNSLELREKDLGWSRYGDQMVENYERVLSDASTASNSGTACVQKT